MSGHGWVNPRPDGAKARCGGPGICGECSAEQIAAVGSEPLLLKRTEEEREAYYIEKLAELVMARREVAALIAERDALKWEVNNLKGLNEMLEEDIKSGMPPTYCPDCSSCGEDGCCNPGNCKAVKCLYGEDAARSYREMGQELDAALTEQDALKAALTRLVAAKDEKDANGETPRYHELKQGAWEQARETLARYEKPASGAA